MLALLEQAPPLDQTATDLAAQLNDRITQLLTAPRNEADQSKAMCDRLCRLARRNFEGLDALAGQVFA